MLKNRLRSLRRYKKQLEAKQNEADAVNDTLITSERAESPRLKLRLEQLEECIREIELRLNKLYLELSAFAALSGRDLNQVLASEECEDDNTSLLISLLLSYQEQLFNVYKVAYKYSFLEMPFQEIPLTLEMMLLELANRPSNFLESFVAYLCNRVDLPEPLTRSLREWGNSRNSGFSELIDKVQLDLQIISQNDVPLLMIVLKPKEDEQKFFVDAWLILDSNKYDRTSRFKNMSSFGGGEAYFLEEIPNLLGDIIIESHSFINISDVSSSNIRGSSLRLMFFLPPELLNHPIDVWQLNIPPRLGSICMGKNYQMVIRCRDRLDKFYACLQSRWREKWESQLDTCIADSVFFKCRSEDLESKLENLPEELYFNNMVGLRLNNSPKQFGEKSVFSAIFATAMPIAVWVRKDFDNNNDIGVYNTLFSNELRTLPEMVRRLRCSPRLGSHLALMWEDPDCLPPDADLDYKEV